MKDKKQLNEELKELSPWLLSMKEQEDGFKVPVDYFDRLQDEVLQKVQQPTVASEPAAPNWLDELLERIQALFQPRYRLAYAFAAVLVLVAAIWVMNTQTDAYTNMEAMALEEVPSDELLDYINNHLEDFASEDLIQTRSLNDEGMSLPQLLPSPDDSEIEEYLDEIMHDIDVEDIESFL
ncbi:MAG: hypothetical protein Kow0027_16850 [Saprospiraceae bacterium]